MAHDQENEFFGSDKDGGYGGGGSAKHKRPKRGGQRGHSGNDAHHDHMGQIQGSQSTSYMDGVGGQDPVAHDAHKRMNKAHGMSEGLSPKGRYKRSGDDGDEGMGESNICHED